MFSFSKSRKKSSMQFSFHPRDEVPVKKVQLVGDFSEWQPLAMRSQKDGTYILDVELNPGPYEYKFIVDGNWLVDPDNNSWSMNSYGTLNSVAQMA